MNKKFSKDFSKQLRREITLASLFITTLVVHIFGVLPSSINVFLLGGVIILGIIPVALSAWESLLERKINVDLLATIALVFSLIAQEWSSALFINLMLSSARILGLYTSRHTKKTLEHLLSLKPLRARVMREGKSLFIALSRVRVGDHVLVNLGEQIPVDGVVLSGVASIDQASLTGESLPQIKQAKDQVLSSTIVVAGNLVVEAQKVGKETLFERMIALVESSEKAKTRVKTRAERFASWYIGIMLVAAILLYLVTQDERLVLAAILVVCADEIAVAIPIAYVAALGAAARRGMIIKSADILERAASMTKIIMDKTGTLTRGVLSVKHMIPFKGSSLAHAVELSGIVCHNSTHPIAKAISRFAESEGILCREPDHFEEIQGRGIIGTVNGEDIIMGRPEFLEEQGVTFNDKIREIILEEVSHGYSVVVVATKKSPLGIFSLADEIRPHAKEIIENLKRSGIKETIMLTGDNDSIARDVAHTVGIDRYYAGLFPEQKIRILEDHLRPGETVGYIGDGVNDAAVISRADIGIAMGTTGSDVAIESSDIVLVKDDLSKISEVRDLSQKVFEVVRGNFILWALFNIVGLYFVFTGVFGPSEAALYNFLTDFIPIANSIRLLRYQPEKA